ncbi:MAG: hypothetical protein WBF08_00475 [Candidatus Bathyarchaeia archaeon]
MTGIDDTTRKLPINMVLLTTIHRLGHDEIIDRGEWIQISIFIKCNSNNAIKKTNVATNKIIKPICAKNALGSPNPVRTTIVPVKANPAIKPETV